MQVLFRHVEAFSHAGGTEKQWILFAWPYKLLVPVFDNYQYDWSICFYIPKKPTVRYVLSLTTTKLTLLVSLRAFSPSLLCGPHRTQEVALPGIWTSAATHRVRLLELNSVPRSSPRIRRRKSTDRTDITHEKEFYWSFTDRLSMRNSYVVYWNKFYGPWPDLS